MKISKVCCQGCGAALDVDESLRFVTCNYCHARLEVVHDPTVTHTRLLEKLERRTDQLAGDVKVLQLQNDLEQLDREWALYREAALIRGQNGEVAEPSMARSVGGGIFAILGGIAFLVVVGAMGNTAFGLFGLVFIGFGVYSISAGSSKAEAFNEFRERYQARRFVLVRKIEEGRRENR